MAGTISSLSRVTDMRKQGTCAAAKSKHPVTRRVLPTGVCSMATLATSGSGLRPGQGVEMSYRSGAREEAEANTEDDDDDDDDKENEEEWV